MIALNALATLDSVKKEEIYKFWYVLTEMPAGWRIFGNLGSPLSKSVFVYNGKNPFNGREMALLRIRGA